ncbi:TATA element modulatory factor-like isoform X3 [Anoplophora glabripennis]|uniref:TATA element modulatory factor-like isoform X3 n=1 Tax=Anoplophora glabripennis TaxID=217634 RepID=UPI000874CC15|nr:TATA element modulatory factor-like isoform X3 [Anoplophora glabripennis]
MSWFDAAGLANIAKSALKGAQRTIDKALDIKEESNLVPSNTPVDTNSEDFFGNWGITHSGHFKDAKKDSSDNIFKDNNMKSSIWGSFTGSFFDTTEDNVKSTFDNLEDMVDSGTEHFNESKLVVQHGDDAELSTGSKMQTKIDTSNIEKKETTGINTGTKLTSDSLEILGDSIASPSSVEVIGTDSTNSRRQSQHTDEFVSPLDSPWSDNKSSSIEKISPESVEVIPEDQDENSIAEDTMSYTSISESTSATVLDSAFNLHLKPQKMLKDTFNRPDTMIEGGSADLTLSPEKNYSFPDAITRAPSRTNMHLPLAQVNQLLIDTQPHSNKDDITNILQKTNIIDIPQDDNIVSSGSETQLDVSTDEGSQSDKTVIANDNIMESSSDTSTTTETSSHSAFLKNMLADAMAEKNEELENSYNTVDLSGSVGIIESISISQLDMPPRENSPISSESRSDLVKIGSDYTSGHTSGDELETTTSSDIEIISSPNGDSSSTQSRQSPAKQTCIKTRSEESTIDTLLCKMTMKKAKGHTRELSEASSISDDSHSSEIDRLLKRISEMTDILESRESKLIDINRRNAELQELNNDLKVQLNSVITKQLESADLSQVTEEYTQRLSALEKKFQQAIREKDSLRKQLEQAKQEAATRMSKGELETLLFEKDEVIKELREEGEKLSKQQLQHSNIIKKLRSKEKENENTIKHLKENIEGLSTESERLKKSLAAKDEVERSQIEAVHQLSNKNKKLETEVATLRSQLDDLSQKYETTRNSLDAAKKELTDKNKTSSELLAREQMLEVLENQKRMTESQNEEICNQLEDLRYKLQQSAEEYVKKEQKLRQENNELLTRLEEIETRNEELSQSILEMSKPLIRQLESLQATHSMKIAAFEKLEEELTLKIRELTMKLQTSNSAERMAKEECTTMKSQLAEVEAQLGSSNHKFHLLQMQLEQQKTERQLSERELTGRINKLNEINNQNKELISKQEEQITTLQQELLLVKSSNIEARHQPQIGIIQNQEKSEGHNSNVDLTAARSNSNSPTLSLGKISNSESMGSSFWSQDEPFDLGQVPRYTNMYEMQMLQTNLKQREGEVQQLQWELNRREQERSLLNSEISSLLTRVEDLESKSSDYDILQTQFNELQQQYETLCQLYGEKVEENEELKLDLTDVKDMYKSQIDELLKQQKQNAE